MQTFVLGTILIIAGRAHTDPVPLIIDTDMSWDVDDVAAVCMANALADRREAELLAIVHDTGYPEGIGMVSTIMHYYGRDNVPLGAFKGLYGRDPEGKNWVTGRYIPDVVQRYNSPVKNYSAVPDAVSVYRRALAKAADHSVVISSIGMVTNIAALLQSPPDAVSALNGTELVGRKVKTVVWMGGWYPPLHPNGRATYNFACGGSFYGHGLNGGNDGCNGAAAVGVNGMPATVEQIFSDIGDSVYTGTPLLGCVAESSPCRQAFVDNQGPGIRGRCSWDPIVTLLAVRGADAIRYTKAGIGGTNYIDQNGANFWRSGDASNQSYIVPNGSDQRAWLGQQIDDLLCMPAKNQTPPVQPAAANTTYTQIKGFNCYGPRNGNPAHGSKDLESPPDASCGQMSIAACQQKCNALPGCTAVTVSAVEGKDGVYNCYRKANVVLGQCDTDTDFDTWMQGAWSAALGFNCYGTRDGSVSHGARDLEHPPTASCGNMPLTACFDQCNALTDCSGVTVQLNDDGTFQCFRKADISLEQCDKNSNFITYVK